MAVKNKLIDYLRPAFLLFSVALSSCAPETVHIVAHPNGYMMDNPRVVKLPAVLNEISGISYYPKDSSLFAVQDEEGFLYKIFPYHTDSMMRWKFAGHGDFEDLLVLNDKFYILRSDGDLLLCSVGDSVTSVKYDFPQKGNEFESVYYDAQLQRILLVCKDCEEDKKKVVSTFQFDPQTNAFVADSFKFDAKEIARIQGQDKIKFKPSAAAINPLNGKIYLLSSVNKLLVIANKDGTIDNAYALDPGIYKQPEGIAFAPDGTMFISNESADIGAANILIIPYQPTKK